MKEIYINVDEYNSDVIKTTEGNNNAEVYKIYLQYDNEKIDLTEKTVNLAFLKIGSTEGDIIENLNVTNPPEGEITLKITNKLTKRNGTYSCQLAISGKDDFLEHTATFTLTVENNIFKDITKAIADSKDFTYLENILDKASKLSEKLKENTSSATNINSNLESNITEANNINSKLLENTSTATGLNKNLESNIDLAKEVKETIKDLDTKNTEATSNIGQLTDLNNKAQELSNNINQALPLNSELVRNTESAKVTNTNLAATNQEATSKNTELQASLEKTKEFIDGLDGSQNIPQLRLDVTELQNGLKSNQALAYQGSSISSNDTLEGRTEGMRIKGRTLVNLVNIRKMILSKETTFEDDIIKFRKTGSDITYLQIPFLSKPNTTYTIMYTIVKNTVEQPDSENYILYPDGVFGDFSSTMNTFPQNGQTGLNKFCLNTKSALFGKFSLGFHRVNIGAEIWIKNLMILEGDWTNKEIPDFFEGIKSFGEAEKVEDKYKISILSTGKNLWNIDLTNISDFEKTDDGYFTNTNNNPFEIDILLPNPNSKYTFSASGKFSSDMGELFVLEFIDENGDIDIVSQRYINGDNISATNTRKVKSLRFCFPWFHRMKKAYIKNIQLEESSNPTPYEHYKENKKDILIKEPLHEGNYLYEDNGQVKVYKEAKKYIFNGDENWSKHSNSGNGLFVAIIWDGFSDCSPTSSVICNKLKNERTTSKENVIYFVSKCPIITVSEKTIGGDTVEHFKTWLKSNPIEIIYQLVTPTVEIVENCVDIDLDTYQDKTYFSINNTIPGSLDFKVPSNIASIVQNTAREVNNIWDVINNLLVPGILKANGNLAMIKLNNNLK